MSNKIIAEAESVKHPKNEGVFMKHFFASADNDRLNNVEVTIEPGHQIAPHVHDNSTEFYYVVEGEGEFLIDGDWTTVKKGYAMKAPQGEEHALKNTGDNALIAFSTFSPPIR